jgi:hypothetical protein
MDWPGIEPEPICVGHFGILNVFEGKNFAEELTVSTWVISEVLHNVCFLFENEFILQNTFTGLQYNLHCALPHRGFFNFGNKSESGGLNPPDFELFRRNHSVGNASETLRSCLTR